MGLKTLTKWIAIALGNEWFYLFLMGTMMAVLSFAIDFLIENLQEVHYIMYASNSHSYFASLMLWVSFSSVLVFVAVLVTRTIAPKASGSGIPEMKTILRSPGLHKEFVTWHVLVAKLLGLVMAIGSRMPIGKEGPFIHVASIFAIHLCKVQNFILRKRIEDARMTELLSAACAIGVSCCFGAPIGGVLFSIEVTSTYFAVRDYWRAFFGSVMSALVFRILAVFWKDEETLTALFRTNFRVDFPFDPQEIIAFVVIGIVSGLAAANFVAFHKYLNKKIPVLFKSQSQRQMIYPVLVCAVYSLMTFPGGLGRLIAGELTDKQAIMMLFDNATWSNPDTTAFIDERQFLAEGELEHLNESSFAVSEVEAFGWDRATGKPTGANLYVSLTLFIVLQYLAAAFAQTIEYPCGVFMPVFMIGGAFGRLVGESMFAWFPMGFKGQRIIPGGYAVVGAAAFAGGVTHTISTSVIVFELTGQISHCLPVLLAVLISNAIAQYFAPSFYDSIITQKKLPHLPDLRSYQNYNTCVENFMKRDVAAIHALADATQIREILGRHKYSVFPLIDSVSNKVLLGSISRTELSHSVEMSMPRPLDSATVNAAPAMITEKTSLHRVHTMFSLLNLKRAWVVNGGRLVGIVTTIELSEEIVGTARKFNLDQRARSCSSIASEDLEHRLIESDHSEDDYDDNDVHFDRSSYNFNQRSCSPLGRRLTRAQAIKNKLI